MDQNQPFLPWFGSLRRLLVFFVIILILIPIGAYLIRSKTQLFSEEEKQINKPVVVKRSSLSVLAAESHPKLYYADLLFDPRLKTTTLLSSKLILGDNMSLQKNPPASSSGQFLYKVEVTSLKGEVLNWGWKSDYKEIIQTKDKLYRLRISLPFIQDSLVRIYANGKDLIWTGKMGSQ